MQKQIDITGAVLETERLILRPWQESDLEDFYAYASVPGVGEMAGWKHHESREESLRILHLFITGKHTFALVDKKSGRAIGSLGLEMPNELAAEEDKDFFGCEIGYVLSRDHWGQGLMPEAVKEVIRFCLEDLGMQWVTCAHFMENGQSRRVIEKCGFQYVRDMGYGTQLGDSRLSRLYVIRKK